MTTLLQTYEDLHKLNTVLNHSNNFLVGGSVRDIYLNFPHSIISDFDITTSSSIDDIKFLLDLNQISWFELKGTITAVVGENNYEITPFKGSSLEEDLNNRDFTVNTLFISLANLPVVSEVMEDSEDIERSLFNLLRSRIEYINSEVYIDFQNTRIQAVSETSLVDDPIRILRAIRFAMQYDFEISYETLEQIYDYRHLLDTVAKERVRDELVKMVRIFVQQSHKQFEKSFHLFSFALKATIPQMLEMSLTSQNSPWHMYDLFNHSVLSLRYLSGSYILKKDTPDEVLWAILLHDTGKLTCKYFDERKLKTVYHGHPEQSITIAMNILRDLKFSNSFIEEVLMYIKYHDSTFVDTRPSIKRWLNKMSLDRLENLWLIQRCDASTHIGRDISEMANEQFKLKEHAQKIMEEQGAFKVSDLAINGNDLIAIGMPEGPDIGRMLKVALEGVIEDKVANCKLELLKWCKEQWDWEW